jgi:Na+/proline symporter
VTPTLAAILLYLLVQFGIGIWVSRRIRSEADYLIAGRSLGYGLATFSIFATWFGAETIIGAAGTTYREGVSLASAEPFGYALCLVLMGLIFARPLWRRKLTTLADLFRQRYSPGVERFAAIILIPSSVLWAAAQVRAFGSVIASASTLDVQVAITTAAAFVILYTAIGGLLADAITDVIQGAMLAVGLLVVAVAVVAHLGGIGAAGEALASGSGIRIAGEGRASLMETLEAWAIPVCGSVIATELVARVIAARSPDVARRSSIVAGGLYLLLGIIPVFVGLVGWRLMPGLGDPEQLFPAVAQQLLPTVAYALFAGGLISAILSTVDSTLLVASGLLSHNVLVPSLGITAERTKLRLARGGVVVLGIAAYVMALHAEGVFALVEQASALGSAGALVTVSFGLFTTLGGARTAFATLAAGMLVYLAASFGDLPYPFLTSLAASLIAYVGGVVIEIVGASRQGASALDDRPSRSAGPDRPRARTALVASAIKGSGAGARHEPAPLDEGA